MLYSRQSLSNENHVSFDRFNQISQARPESEAEIFKDGFCTNHESYGAYPAVTATAAEYCLVTLAIRTAKQKAVLASLILSMRISPPLHIQMASLLSAKRSTVKPKTQGFVKILGHFRVCTILSIKACYWQSTQYCRLICSCFMDVGGFRLWFLVHHESIICLLMFSFTCFLIEVPHVGGAPYANLVAKCQALGGLSCPVVPQLVTLPILCLKAVTFIRHHGAARGDVTFGNFFFFLLGSVCSRTQCEATKLQLKLKWWT